MTRVPLSIFSSLREQFPPSAVFEGSEGKVWFAGFEPRGSSIAAYFCGDDALGSRGRVWRNRVPGRIMDVASGGGLPILRLGNSEPRLADLLPLSIAVPALVDIHTDLPADQDALRAQLLTSTTREDFRRIRRANFTYRITTEPDAIREFHAKHYTPLVAQQFPEDGRIESAEKMMRDLDHGGELICADIDGEWVAGLFNISREPSYALMTLGIRDADETVRQKRVVAALIIRSLERAVELGRDRATLGRSLPFLGKGPVWFKAKWSGTITRRSDTEDLHMFMDLRHAPVRRMLSGSPVIHSEGDALVVSTWLEPGDKPLKAITRDAGRFPGISRWYVLSESETLAAGAEQLAASERILTVPVAPSGDGPIWLGDVLAKLAATS